MPRKADDGYKGPESLLLTALFKHFPAGAAAPAPKPVTPGAIEPAAVIFHGENEAALKGMLLSVQSLRAIVDFWTAGGGLHSGVLASAYADHTDTPVIGLILGTLCAGAAFLI